VWRGRERGIGRCCGGATWEGVADVLNALYLFHVVVIEDGVSKYSPNAPIHLFFMSFFQSLVLPCAFALLVSDLHVSCVIFLNVDLCYFVACRPLLHGTRSETCLELVESKNATTVNSQCFDDSSKVLMHAPTTHLSLVSGNWELGSEQGVSTLPSKLKHFLTPSVSIGLFCLPAFM